MFEVLMAVKI